MKGRDHKKKKKNCPVWAVYGFRHERKNSWQDKPDIAPKALILSLPSCRN